MTMLFHQALPAWLASSRCQPPLSRVAAHISPINLGACAQYTHELPAITITFAFTVALAALSANASPAVIHVPGDQPSIQSAIDAAANGEEVVVALACELGVGYAADTAALRR